jgi:Uma2 family endonuclease
VVTLLDRPLDFEDLVQTPDDGNCYEILDGALVVTPAPGPMHQRVVRELLLVLDPAARARGLEVFTAPLAWRIGPGQVPEPDLMVVAADAVGERMIERPPALVVEVVSASGGDRDRFEKRRIYARAGAFTYWLVDPERPGLTVLRLAGADYEEETTVVGSTAYATEDPVSVRVRPADLLG